MSHASGNKLTAVAPHSKLYQGPFGRICPTLPGWRPKGIPDHKLDEHFIDFANKHMVEAPGEAPEDLATDGTKRAALEAEFSSNVPAGYTYFGQFVDHDITFDPAPLGVRQVDPNGLNNFRTPRLDLDNVYGRGPDDQPYLYDPDNKAKMAIGQIEGTSLPDLPRYTMPGQAGSPPKSVALIGDMRNDENSMVSQLQLAFLLAHNTLVDRAVSEYGLDVSTGEGRGEAFRQARRTLTWLYQHVVWNDYVRRIANDTVYKAAMALNDTADGRKRWDLGLKDVYNWKHQPFMPVEFSGAAYRFGHSMVRNAYQTNNDVRGFGDFAPIFDNTGAASPDDLRGFRPMRPENVIQWDWFLQMTSSGGPFPQMARKIDTKLANALSHLHEGPSGSPNNILAFRNLKRGVSLGLPSGPELAKKYCIKQVRMKEHEPDALWYYILREAEALPGSNSGQMLGRLGSTIVCAVFAGLMKGDPCSWVNLDPCWSPSDDPLLKDGTDNVDDPAWSLASIIRLSGLPVKGGDIVI